MTTNRTSSTRGGQPDPIAARRVAAQIKKRPRVPLPKLKYWNYGACEHHEEPTPACEYRACGGDFFDHQTVTISWLYFNSMGLVASVPGSGKAQPLTAKVLVPGGWSKMGDLKPGDLVLSPDGTPVPVLEIFPQGVQPIYKITLSDGSTTRATGDHLWKVRARRGWYTRTTEELRTGTNKTLPIFSSDGRATYQLPRPFIETGTVDLPVSSYTLGALLGDGSLGTSHVALTTMDQGILERVLKENPGVVARKDKNSKISLATTYRLVSSYGRSYVDGVRPVNPLLTALREIGASPSGNLSKRIPDIYMHSDSTSRLDLLRGLMDTDGSISNGHLEFVSVSKGLAEDVLDIVRSLGGTGSLTEKKTSWTYLGEQKTGIAYRVGFNLPANPFYIDRKASKYTGPGQKTRRIISIEPDGFEEAQCILLDSDDHLYVTDDYIVTHNTNIALGLTCLLKERGELPGRAIFIVQTPVTLQWLAEAQRFTKLKVVATYSGMTREKRIEAYSSAWDILIIGFHMLNNDVDVLTKFNPSLVVTDDVDPLLNSENTTHKSIVAMAEKAKRVCVMNASSVQVRLQQIHAAMVPIGGKKVWGSEEAFANRYIIREKFSSPIPGKKDKNGNQIRKVDFKDVGYKNWEDFKKKLEPWVIRYGYEDLNDVKMPKVMPPENVFLEMSARQRKKYEELRAGILRIVREQGETIKHTNALTMINYGQMVCAGLPALGEEDGPGASVKLDWIMNRLTDAWVDQKIVVYIKNPGLIKALQARLDKEGIGYGTVWGLEANPEARAADQKRFWEDPNCRVFIGTSAMERGLNLHCSNIVVCVDMLLNPSRMEQIVGRTRRAGSAHDRIFTFYLFCADTQEDRYLEVLRKRSAMISQVWGTEAELFESLSSLELLSMFRP